MIFLLGKTCSTSLLLSSFLLFTTFLAPTECRHRHRVRIHQQEVDELTTIIFTEKTDDEQNHFIENVHSLPHPKVEEEENTVAEWERDSGVSSGDGKTPWTRILQEVGNDVSENGEEEAIGSLANFPRASKPSKFSEFWRDASRNGTFYRVIHICYDNSLGTMFAVEEKQGGKNKERECSGNAVEKVATGRYRNEVNKTGWGLLEVETFGDFEPELQAYAAGVVEGVLTQLQIYYHYQNTVSDMCTGYNSYCSRLFRYLDKNLEWISGEVLHRPATDLYWRHVNLTYTQLTGIFDGYSTEKGKNYRPRVSYTRNQILMLQISGDLIDLEKALNKTPNFHEAGGVEPGHCSALVKVTEGNGNLLAAHVSMSGFNTMNRVMKLYKFAYDQKQVPGHTVSFSAYPGVLASGDDYTLTSAGLLSIETTIAVFDNSKFLRIKPEGQLQCWVRSYIANFLARTAHQWTKVFARYNSGTYNNQWTVVDYKLFKPGQPLPDHELIWVLEQIPGKTASRDVTWFLRKYTYWPSYNIPYIDKISKESGFLEMGYKNNWYRWGYSPRARIFHRDHSKVHDIDSLKDLMRYNDYKHDEFARCKCTPFPFTAEGAPSTRGDLNPANGTYEVAGMGHRNHGAIDYKGTDYAMFQKLQIHVIGGPTYGGNSNIPPFNWNTFDIQAPHEGQPDIWKFDPFTTEWQTPVNVTMQALLEKEEESEHFYSADGVEVNESHEIVDAFVA